MRNTDKNGQRCAGTNRDGTPCTSFVNGRRHRGESQTLCAVHRRRSPEQIARHEATRKRRDLEAKTIAEDEKRRHSALSSGRSEAQRRPAENSGPKNSDDQTEIPTLTPAERRRRWLDRESRRLSRVYGLPTNRFALRARLMDPDD